MKYLMIIALVTSSLVNIIAVSDFGSFIRTDVREGLPPLNPYRPSSEMKTTPGPESQQHSISRAPEIGKNILKFSYGINFKYNGQLHHHLDRIWVVTKIPLPTWPNLGQFPNHQYSCSEVKEYNRETYGDFKSDASAVAYGNAYWHECVFHKWQMELLKRRWLFLEKQLREKIQQDLPTALHSRYDQPSSSTGPVRRPKRGIAAIIGGLVTIASETVSWFLQSKKTKVINKALQKLDHDNRAVQDKLQQMGNEFLLYGQFDLEGQEKTVKTMNEMGQQLSRLGDQIRKVADYNFRAKGVQKDKVKLAAMLDNYKYNHQKYRVGMKQKYEYLVQELIRQADKLLKAIATLSTGRIPIELFNPSKLDEMVKAAYEIITSGQMAYEIAIKSLHQYYDMKLATFMVDNDKKFLVVTFPILIKPLNLPPMSLYEIERVYVPIPDVNTKADSYTRVKIMKPYIATSTDYYIQLRIPELMMCKKIDREFYCEELFLMKHKTKHSCESALFYNLPAEDVGEGCEFEYIYNTTVQPSVLDGGDEIILANLAAQKRLSCQDDHNLDVPLQLPQQTYAKVNRSILCQCQIEADLTALLGSVSACQESTRLPPLKFTVNTAFNIFLAEYLEEFDDIYDYFRIDHSSFINQMNETLEQEILPVELEEVLDPDTNKHPETLEQLLVAIAKKRRLINDTQERLIKEEEIMKLREPPPSLTWLMRWEMTFATMMSFVLTASLIVSSLYMCKRMNHMKTLVLGLVSSGVNVPTATAYNIMDHTEDLVPECPTDLNEVVCKNIKLTYIVTGLSLAGFAYIVYNMLRSCNFFKGIKIKTVNDIYLFISDGKRFTTVKLKTLTGHLNLFTATGQIGHLDLHINKGIFFDYLDIVWTNTDIAYRLDPLPMPSRVPIGFFKRFQVRSLLKNPQTIGYIMFKHEQAWLAPQSKISPIFNPTGMTERPHETDPESTSDSEPATGELRLEIRRLRAKYKQKKELMKQQQAGEQPPPIPSRRVATQNETIV